VDKCGGIVDGCGGGVVDGCGGGIVAKHSVAHAGCNGVDHCGGGVVNGCNFDNGCNGGIVNGCGGAVAKHTVALADCNGGIVDKCGGIVDGCGGGVVDGCGGGIVAKHSVAHAGCNGVDHCGGGVVNGCNFDNGCNGGIVHTGAVSKAAHPSPVPPPMHWYATGVSEAKVPLTMPSGPGLAEVPADLASEKSHVANAVSRKPTPASPGHLVMCAHAFALAALQGACKGSFDELSADTIANANAVTPIGSHLLRQQLSESA